MYLNTTSLQRTSESEIRSAFPNTSFPQPFQPPEGYAVLFATPQPTFDPITQAVREAAPVLTDKGHWEQAWDVVELDPTIAEANRAKAKADLIASFDRALTNHLDQTAQSRKYDNRITCALRAGYAGPFQAEGQAFASWMDTCNALAYQILAEVLAGTRPIPESTEAFIALLPEMVWPT